MNFYSTLFVLSVSAFSHLALAEEGLFYPDSAPKISLVRLGLTSSQIEKSTLTTGALVLFSKRTITKEKIAEKRKQNCGLPIASKWEAEYCSRINQASCDSGCEVESYRLNCSGVFVNDRDNHFFVTARHCIESVDHSTHPIKARFIDAISGDIRDINLEPTDLTKHYLPNDISILRVPKDTPFQPHYAEILTTELPKGQSVYSLGFPYLGYRKNRKADYELLSGGMRVTLGAVVEPNLEQRSYCGFSNENDIAKPESWTLDLECSNYDYSKHAYVGREERNPMLTDTDMTYGMSGSPLFDSKGQLVGIGSTILSADPIDYDSSIYAVYGKAANLTKYLDILYKQPSKAIKK